MTKAEAESPFGQRLIHQLLAISRDGHLSLEEVAALDKMLENAPRTMQAVPYLYDITQDMLSDRTFSDREANTLRVAIGRVVPKAVRIEINRMLAEMGLPPSDAEHESPVGKRSWQHDPATARQIDFIRDLGATPQSNLTKGEASILIDDLLDRRPPSRRQLMVLRFFARLDLASHTKDEVCVWMDNLYDDKPHYQLAWQKFKQDIGFDASHIDIEDVPLGGYKNYIDKWR
jgi:hypothetical protein